MTLNFSRIHRLEPTECAFIVSKRTAYWQKPQTGDSVSKAQLLVSLHFWIPGASARALHRTANRVSEQQLDTFAPIAVRVAAAARPGLHSFYFFFFRAPGHTALMQKRFQIWLGSACNFVIHKRRSYGACSSSMYGEKPRLPLLLMPSRANRCDSHVSPGFYHIYATDYLIEASTARHIRRKVGNS